MSIVTLTPTAAKYYIDQMMAGKIVRMGGLELDYYEEIESDDERCQTIRNDMTRIFGNRCVPIYQPFDDLHVYLVWVFKVNKIYYTIEYTRNEFGHDYLTLNGESNKYTRSILDYIEYKLYGTIPVDLIAGEKNKHAKKIQINCFNWLWKPVCNDGKLGINAKLLKHIFEVAKLESLRHLSKKN